MRDEVIFDPTIPQAGEVVAWVIELDTEQGQRLQEFELACDRCARTLYSTWDLQPGQRIRMSRRSENAIGQRFEDRVAVRIRHREG